MATPGRGTCMCRHTVLDMFRDRQEIKYRWNGEEERFFSSTMKLGHEGRGMSC